LREILESSFSLIRCLKSSKFVSVT
jgi:hypothetical protein